MNRPHGHNNRKGKYAFGCAFPFSILQRKMRNYNESSIDKKKKWCSAGGGEEMPVTESKMGFVLFLSWRKQRSTILPIFKKFLGVFWGLGLFSHTLQKKWVLLYK